MVTMKDIMNMGRKIKRSNNPKTLARYQAQIDAWIAELETAQAQAQADILTLEEKIKMEEEAKANLKTNLDNRNRSMPTAQKSEGIDTSKEQAKRLQSK